MNFKFQKLLSWPICLILLIGIIAAGNSNVICIGNNGHVKFEALCLPCCGEGENSCETSLPREHKEEFEDCSHCSDIELDTPLMSSRNQEIDSEQLSRFTLALFANIDSRLISEKNGDSLILNYYLARGQGPPTFYISTTVLRC